MLPSRLVLVGSDRGRPGRKGADKSGFTDGPWKADGLRRRTRWRVSWWSRVFFSGKGGQSVAQAVTDESCSCPWLPSSRAVKPGLALCWTQWPSQSYVEKSDGAHVLRDDGISLHWGHLIGWDERHRRNTIRQSFWSSEHPSIQACYLHLHTPAPRTNVGWTDCTGSGSGSRSRQANALHCKRPGSTG